MIEKVASTEYQLSEVIKKRWSPRAFDKNFLLDKDKILTLCEAMRWSPSCYGEEPWRVIVFDKATNYEAFEKAISCLDVWNQRWVKNVSVLFLIMSNKFFKRNGKINRWAEYDAGGAAENLCLQAVDLGLATHQIGGFDYELTKKMFDIPDEFEILSFVAIGKQTEPEILDEDLLKLELSPRKRSPLSKNFFFGSLDNPID